MVSLALVMLMEPWTPTTSAERATPTTVLAANFFILSSISVYAR